MARVAGGNILTINNPASGSTCSNGIARWQARDTLVAVVTMENRSGVEIPVSAAGFTPAGFKLKSGVQMSVLYRSLSTAPSSVAFTWGPSTAAAVTMYAFSQANAFNPIGALTWTDTNTTPSGVSTSSGQVQGIVLARSGPNAANYGALTPGWPTTCTATQGRSGRLSGTSFGDMTGTSTIAVGMFARPLPVKTTYDAQTASGSDPVTMGVLFSVVR